MRRRRLRDVTHPDDQIRDAAQVEQLLSEGEGSYAMLKRCIHASGQVFWAELNVMLQPQSGARAPQFLTMIRKAAVSADALTDVHNKAFRDPLTSVPNRHALEEQLIAAECHSRRTGKRFGVALLDLDGFKSVNDQFGHMSGDELLCQLARRLQQAVRVQDFVARLGGDEFAILLRDIDDDSALRHRLLRLQQRLGQRYCLSAGEVYVPASLGWAVYPDEADSALDVLQLADVAMYRSKRQQLSLPQPMPLEVGFCDASGQCSANCTTVPRSVA